MWKEKQPLTGIPFDQECELNLFFGTLAITGGGLQAIRAELFSGTDEITSVRSLRMSKNEFDKTWLVTFENIKNS